MKKENIQRDELTARLMADTAERPSAALNARVMERLMKERRKVYVYTVRAWLTPQGLLCGIVAYLALAGALLWYLSDPTRSEALPGCSALVSHLPVVLTIATFFSCFLLFSTLDKWLRWRAHRAASRSAKR